MALLVFLFAWAAQAAEHEPHPPLPFAIADEKKLDEQELREKKEGTFFTGLPRFSSDPVNGIGLGADVFLYRNGDKSDPFFAYTPYRQEFELHAFLTSKEEKEVAVGADIPYFDDSKWRLRFEAAWEDNPNLLYFGATQATQNPLSYGGQAFSRYDDYVDELSRVGNEKFNTYRKREVIANLSVERSFADGKLRALAGFEIGRNQITPFTDAGQPSLLASDQATQGLLGVGTSLLTFAQAGLVYDTRDLEPDPSSGTFVELTDEVSTSALGSDFEFNKVFFHAKQFVALLPSTFRRLIFAWRFGLESTSGASPFFEYQDAWSSEGSIEGLGGLRTLRGYKQNRFMAPLMNFENLELRYRFWETSFLGQQFTFNLVPFFDAGRVWDSWRDLTLRDLKFDYGLGLRVPWNQSTVLMLDYAVSAEDSQVFFNFGHIF